MRNENENEKMNSKAMPSRLKSSSFWFWQRWIWGEIVVSPKLVSIQRDNTRNVVTATHLVYEHNRAQLPHCRFSTLQSPLMTFTDSPMIGLANTTSMRHSYANVYCGSHAGRPLQICRASPESILLLTGSSQRTLECIADKSCPATVHCRSGRWTV